MLYFGSNQPICSAPNYYRYIHKKWLLRGSYEGSDETDTGFPSAPPFSIHGNSPLFSIRLLFTALTLLVYVWATFLKNQFQRHDNLFLSPPLPPHTHTRDLANLPRFGPLLEPWSESSWEKYVYRRVTLLLGIRRPRQFWFSCRTIYVWMYKSGEPEFWKKKKQGWKEKIRIKNSRSAEKETYIQWRFLGKIKDGNSKYKKNVEKGKYIPWRFLGK